MTSGDITRQGYAGLKIAAIQLESNLERRVLSLQLSQLSDQSITVRMDDTAETSPPKEANNDTLYYCVGKSAAGGVGNDSGVYECERAPEV